MLVTGSPEPDSSGIQSSSSSQGLLPLVVPWTGGLVGGTYTGVMRSSPVATKTCHLNWIYYLF